MYLVIVISSLKVTPILIFVTSFRLLVDLSTTKRDAMQLQKCFGLKANDYDILLRTQVLNLNNY